MANKENLKPLNKRTKSEQRKIQSKGGKKSGQVRRAKRDFQDACLSVLKMALSNDDLTELADIVSYEDVEGRNIDIQAAVVLKQAQLALQGSTRAAEFLRDSSGQKPKETLEVNSNVTLSEKVKTLQEYMSKYDDDGN